MCGSPTCFLPSQERALNRLPSFDADLNFITLSEVLDATNKTPITPMEMLMYGNGFGQRNFFLEFLNLEFERFLTPPNVQTTSPETHVKQNYFVLYISFFLHRNHLFIC